MTNNSSEKCRGYYKRRMKHYELKYDSRTETLSAGKSRPKIWKKAAAVKARVKSKSSDGSLRCKSSNVKRLKDKVTRRKSSLRRSSSS